MTTQKIILSILVLGVVLGLGFIAIKSNNNAAVKDGNIEKPIVLPTKPSENPINNFTEFGKAITLKLNDKITFSDGLNVTLKEINDSRCPKDVQCIWAGEISGAFTLSGGKIAIPKEIRLGTTNSKSVVLEGYTFSLQSATEKSMTIIVDYKTP